MKYLLFDYDGTLHDSTALYPPAFRAMYAQMERDGFAPPRVWQDEEITRWLGYNAADMWRDFLPQASPEQQAHYGAQIGREMLRRIQDGQARLYPGARETLEQLARRGYAMVLLSNCKEDYLRAHREYFSLDDFFCGYYAAETYGFRPKHEIFSVIAKEHPGEFTVIGDRIHDMELARRNALPAIGCRYGFGKDEELAYASRTVGDISELLRCLPDPV